LQRQQQGQQSRQILQDHRPQDVPRPSTEIPNQQNSQFVIDTDDIAEKAARAAHFAMQGFGLNQGAPMLPQHQVSSQIPQHQLPGQVQQQTQGQGQQQIPPHPQKFQYHFEHQPAPSQYYQQPPFQQNQHMSNPMNQQPVSMNQQHQAYADQNAIPYPTQSAPTQVLYERARMAATAKASPSSRRAGHPSQRRPWTTDEENSLMAGLDRVKGPHWSQILAMFGPGGTINETLKDRNQVQLKDKARNLKLFFLKSGIEVPYYLQFVTGELKTRAPAQAMKNEQRDQSQVVDDRAHVEGVMTLAGGPMQDPEHINGGMEDDIGDAEEGDISIESFQDGAPHQNGSLPPNFITGDAVPVGREQQQYVGPNEATSQLNGVHADNKTNYELELAARGFNISAEGAKIEAVSLV